MSNELEETPQDKGKERKGYEVPADFILDTSLTPQQRRRKYKEDAGKKGGLATAIKGSNIHQKYDPRFDNMSEELAALGLPDCDMAYLFNVSPATFSRWITRHASLRNAIKRGETTKKTGLLSHMLKNVQDGSFAVQIFLAKNWLGMTDKVDSRMTGEIGITYKSNIPREKGSEGVDPETIKKKGKKR